MSSNTRVVFRGHNEKAHFVLSSRKEIESLRGLRELWPKENNKVCKNEMEEQHMTYKLRKGEFTASRRSESAITDYHASSEDYNKK